MDRFRPIVLGYILLQFSIGLHAGSTQFEAPFTLEAALLQAFSNYKPLLEKDFQVLAQNQSKLKAISKWLPSLSTTTKSTLSQIPAAQPNIFQSYFATNIQITQEVFNPNTLYGIFEQNILLDLEKLNRKTIENELNYWVRHYYYKLVNDQQQIENISDQLHVLDVFVEQEKIRFHHGVINDFDVNQSKVEKSNVLATLYHFQEIKISDQNELLVFLGSQPFDASSSLVIETRIPLKNTLIQSKVEDLKNTQKLETPRTMFSDLETEIFIDKALENRPELLAQKTKIKAANNSYERAKKNYIPSLSFVLQYGTPGFNDTLLSQQSTSISGQSFFLSGFLNLTFEPFKGGEQIFNIGEKRYRAFAEKRSYNYQAEKTIAGVRTQIAKLDAALFSYNTITANVKLAQQALDQAGKLRKEGAITAFNYLGVVSQLINARSLFIDAEFQILDAYFGLERLMGCFS